MTFWWCHSAVTEECSIWCRVHNQIAFNARLLAIFNFIYADINNIKIISDATHFHFTILLALLVQTGHKWRFDLTIRLNRNRKLLLHFNQNYWAGAIGNDDNPHSSCNITESSEWINQLKAHHCRLQSDYWHVRKPKTWRIIKKWHNNTRSHSNTECNNMCRGNVCICVF